MQSVNQGSLLVLSKAHVNQVLENNEQAIIDIVKETYIYHEQGKTSSPHSTFLKFPNEPKNRIIGLPAYVDGENSIAGIKWVASFPENIKHGIDRASATIIANSTITGQPIGFVEGSIISAKRTAASAVLGATSLLQDKVFNSISQIGCGPINQEILKFLLHTYPHIRSIYIFDTDQQRADDYSKSVQMQFPKLTVTRCTSLDQATKAATVITLATTAASPYIHETTYFQPGSVILNISLRDLGPDIIKGAINIVDDLDHVNRENTSIHLTSLSEGNTSFVLANIGTLLLNPNLLIDKDKEKLRIYSPFGLGVLDMALTQYVLKEAKDKGLGTVIDNFLN